MNKKIRIATITALMVILVAVGSFSAVLGEPTTETRAERMVEVAQEASEKVADLIELVSSNLTALDMIEIAGLDDEFDANLTRYDEGVENVTNALACLEADDYEGAIENATEAMSIFREVYRAIHVILCNADVQIGQIVDPEELDDAITRALQKVADLKELISEDADIYSNLVDAETLLLNAQDELALGNIETAKDYLRQATTLISEVCQYLKEMAQELNPSRIRDYCEEAYQYQHRFSERFGQAETEGFDVNGFLQGFGYQNEDDFRARFQEMINTAQNTDDVDDAVGDLQEIGRLVRQLDSSLTQNMEMHRAQHGQTTGGAGQEGSGSETGQNSGSQTNSGSGQMGAGNGGH